MEDLLIQEEDGGLGLNIVVQEAPKQEISSSRPKKKKNKYDRRRERARQAKLLKQQQQQEQQCGSDVVESNKEDDGKETDVVAKQVTTTTQEEPSLCHAQDEQASAIQVLETIPPSQPQPPALTPPPSSFQQNSNNKKKHTTMISLENEQERARYMREFHARPLEMDRRSGALGGSIAPSLDSSHLFAGGDRFESLGLHSRLVTALQSKAFQLERPTVVQTKAILTHQQHPHDNLLVQSETGSGKTLAYLLPIIQSLAVDKTTGQVKRIDRQQGGTRCIILCPTRELASQTATVVEKLCQSSFSFLVAGCTSGGERRKSEKARLRKGISILVCTPGRLLDHLCKTESLLMSLKGKLEWLVLDEADRLLDMGLGGQVEQIVQYIRSNQPKSGIAKDGVTWQSMLVSATVTKHVQELANKLLGGNNKWSWVRATEQEEQQTSNDKTTTRTFDDGNDFHTSTPRQLNQLHMTVTAKLRLSTLIAFMVKRVEKNERVVVFMSTCDGVDYHHALFQAMDCILPNEHSGNGGIFGNACSVYKLHGNVPHAERQVILQKFNQQSSNNKRAALLLATDVAARGLNLSGVDWTIQYDPPCEVADYAHRAGRAARAGRAGHSLLFLLPSERQFLDVLKLKGLDELSALSLTSTLNQAAEICSDLAQAGKDRSGGGFSSSKSGESFCAELQRRLEDLVLQDDAQAKAAHKETRRKKGQPRQKVTGRLLQLARKAYLSFIRSYPTKEKSVKHIFSTRALHFGHMARSFALKEDPTTLAMKSKQTIALQTDNEIGTTSLSKKRSSALAFEEQIMEEAEHAVIQKRRRRVARDSAAPPKEKSTTDSKKSRALLMAGAAKLQNGMDAF